MHCGKQELAMKNITEILRALDITLVVPTAPQLLGGWLNPNTMYSVHSRKDLTYEEPIMMLTQSKQYGPDRLKGPPHVEQ
jgi:hypothetical protein